MKRKYIFLILASALLFRGALFPFCSAAEFNRPSDKARERWMKAYLNLEQAEQAEKDGQYNEALKKYRASLEEFKIIRKNWPRWNTSLLTYRINYCRKRIKNLSSTGKQAAAPAAAASHASAKNFGEKVEKLTDSIRLQNIRIQNREREIEKLKTDLLDTTTLLQQAKTEAERNSLAAKQTKELVNENQKLKRQLALKDHKLSVIAEKVRILEKSKGLEELTEKLEKELAIIRLEHGKEKSLAEKYQLAKEIAENEILEKNKALKEADQQIASLRSSLKVNTQESEQRIKELQSLLKKENNSADPRSEELKAQISKLTSMIDTLQQRNRNLVQTITELQTKTKTSRSESGFYSTKIKKLEKQLAEKETAIHSLQKTIHEQKGLIRSQEEQLLARKTAAITENDSDKETAKTRLEFQIMELEKELKKCTDLYEQERARVAVLEDVIISKKQSNETPVKDAAPSISSELERERRSEEEQMLIDQLFLSGLRAEEKDQTDVALTCYSRILKRRQNHKDALKRTGFIYADKGDDQKAVLFLSRAFTVDQNDHEILTALGMAHLRLEQPDMALSMLSRAVAVAPDKTATQRALGVACSSLGWPKAAAVQFQRALNVDPKDAEAAFNLSLILASVDHPNLKKAAAFYAQAKQNGAEGTPELDEYFNSISEETDESN